MSAKKKKPKAPMYDVIVNGVFWDVGNFVDVRDAISNWKETQ